MNRKQRVRSGKKVTFAFPFHILPGSCAWGREPLRLLGCVYVCVVCTTGYEFSRSPGPVHTVRIYDRTHRPSSPPTTTSKRGRETTNNFSESNPTAQILGLVVLFAHSHTTNRQKKKTRTVLSISFAPNRQGSPRFRHAEPSFRTDRVREGESERASMGVAINNRRQKVSHFLRNATTLPLLGNGSKAYLCFARLLRLCWSLSSGSSSSSSMWHKSGNGFAIKQKESRTYGHSLCSLAVLR